MLAYVYIPVIQKELDVFRVSVWNTHRIRKQKEKELPAGVPEHIYTCPESHGGEKCGFIVTEEQLREVAELANVLDGTDDFLPEDLDKNAKDICLTLKILSQIKHLMHFCILNPILACKEVAQNLHHTGEVSINEH